MLLCLIYSTLSVGDVLMTTSFSLWRAHGDVATLPVEIQNKQCKLFEVPAYEELVSSYHCFVRFEGKSRVQ